MGNCSTENVNKPIETPSKENKKIKLEPNIVLPEAPNFKDAGIKEEYRTIYKIEAMGSYLSVSE